MRAPSASLVVVGNEVLSAKVVDENGPWLAGRLHELGVELRSIQTVRDRVEEIVEALLRERPRVGWLITSGGVGPTHDDVTVAAVAVGAGAAGGPRPPAGGGLPGPSTGGCEAWRCPRRGCGWPTSPRGRS